MFFCEWFFLFDLFEVFRLFSKGRIIWYINQFKIKGTIMTVKVATRVKFTKVTAISLVNVKAVVDGASH